MNERIQELAEQAGIKLPNESEYNGHIYRNSIEKFARLIIGECAQALSRVPGGYDSSVFYKNITTLKNHFGVEE